MGEKDEMVAIMVNSIPRKQRDKACRRTLIALNRVFLFGSYVVCVCRQSVTLQSFSPASPSHCGSFSRSHDDQELTNTQELNVDNIGRPKIGLLSLAYIEQDWFGSLASNLLRSRRVQAIANNSPDWACVGVARIVLFEVKGTRTPLRKTTVWFDMCEDTVCDQFPKQRRYLHRPVPNKDRVHGKDRPDSQ
ncbi:hypothetical protein KCU65_g117, partial [Aureobasidium melanogenum]